MHKLKIGCDPELFLVDAAGAFIASCDRIGGSKDYPRPLPIGDGFAVQEDNVAMEYNIPPASSEEELVTSIKKVQEYLANLVAEQALQISKVSAVSFPVEQLMHYKAMEFGCDPDFNAWKNGRVNPRPKANDPTLRSCGGHVHVGLEMNNKKDGIEFIKYMDLFAGVVSVLQDNGELRKQLYGKAGCFRFKPYGVEYRTLSNYWVFEDKLVRWVWKATTQAMNAWQNHNRRFVFVDDAPLIQECINQNNKALAETLVNKYNLAYA